ncbi:hypothetical protein [Streptomyces sp. NPDC051704]
MARRMGAPLAEEAALLSSLEGLVAAALREEPGVHGPTGTDS